MKERPILFNGPMVRAVLIGQKTQTRRGREIPITGTTMKSLLLVVATCVALSGCVIVPAETAGKACHLLNIASSEAELSPAWYDSAGEVLVACGIRDAKQEAERRSCEAQKRNGMEC